MRRRAARRLAGLAGLILALAGCTSSKAAHVSASTPAPAACSSSPCTAPGAVRWSVSLGVAMKLLPGSPVAYLSAGGARPVLASTGSVLVVGWAGTVVGLDVHTGASRWRSTSLVPSGQSVAAVHPVGTDLAVTTRPTGSSGVGVDTLIDPATGHVILRLPAGVNEGMVWTDGTSVVAVEPTALTRIDIATGHMTWSIPLTAFAAAAVAGDRVVYGAAKTGYRVVTLATGAAVPGHAAIHGGPIATSGSVVVLDGAAGLYDASTGRALWSGATGDEFRSFDPVDKTLYVVTTGAGSVRSVAVASPTPRTLPATITEPDLVTVHAGVAVSQVPSGDSATPGVSFVGRDVRTGRPVWSSPVLNDYFPTPVPGWADAGGQSYAVDYVGGLTCSPANASATACTNVAVTLVND